MTVLLSMACLSRWMKLNGTDDSRHFTKRCAGFLSCNRVSGDFKTLLIRAVYRGMTWKCQGEKNGKRNTNNHCIHCIHVPFAFSTIRATVDRKKGGEGDESGGDQKNINHRIGDDGAADRLCLRNEGL